MTQEKKGKKGEIRSVAQEILSNRLQLLVIQLNSRRWSNSSAIRCRK